MTILVVTHDIDEAVYLSDRIIVIGHKPAVVTEILPVDLPGPRNQMTTRALPEFTSLRSHVLRLIQDAH